MHRNSIFNRTASPVVLWAAVVILTAGGCRSVNDNPILIGRYTNAETGEFFEFTEEGRVRYSVVTDNYTVYFDKGKSYDGRYHFSKSGQLIFQPASTHLGLFSVTLSQSGNRLYLRHRMSSREATFIKEL